MVTGVFVAQLPVGVVEAWLEHQWDWAGALVIRWMVRSVNPVHSVRVVAGDPSAVNPRGLGDTRAGADLGARTGGQR